ncbi:MAG TPA: hypothetical protein VF103_17385, partial [Polyangiaceae bacterium]
PAPVTSQAAFAGTLIAPPPPPRSPDVGLGGTVVLPPPTPTQPQPQQPQPAVTDESTPTVVVETPASFSAYSGPSSKATSRGFPALQPPAESLPRAVRPAEVHAEVHVPSAAPGKPGKNSALLIVIGVLALGLGVVGAVFLQMRSKPKPIPEASPAAPTVTTSATAAEEPAGLVPPPPKADATATATTTATAAPTASTAPETPPPPATAPSAAPTAAPGPPPAVPPASFDLEKLPGDRAALVVHSSATARVFVHGRDYGETNQYLLTSCGIRFVRIGRGFNDFLEPGRSVVVKCGRVNELTVEPDR